MNDFHPVDESVSIQKAGSNTLVLNSERRDNLLGAQRVTLTFYLIAHSSTATISATLPPKNSKNEQKTVCGKVEWEAVRLQREQGETVKNIALRHTDLFNNWWRVAFEIDWFPFTTM